MSTVNKMADEDRSSDNYLQDSESSGYGTFGIIEWPLSKLECIERIGECECVCVCVCVWGGGGGGGGAVDMGPLGL